MDRETGSNRVLGGGGIHHVAVRVRDFDASVAFYRETLGFVPVLAWGEGNGRAVMLDTGRGDCVELFAGGPDSERPEGAWIHLALRVSDCDAVLAKVREAGCVVTMDATDVAIPGDPPMPVRIAFFKGPDGEVLELFSSRQAAR